MAAITLSEAKSQARIDHADEDDLLTTMIDVAEAYVRHATGIPTDPLPTMAKAATLLVFADLYANREAQQDRPLSQNKTVDSLLAMSRDYVGFVQ